MEICCDEVEVSTSVSNGTEQEAMAEMQNDMGKMSQDLFERVKLYVEEVMQRESNKKRW